MRAKRDEDLIKKARAAMELSEETVKQARRLQSEHGQLLQKLKRRDAAMEKAQEDMHKASGRAQPSKKTSR